MVARQQSDLYSREDQQWRARAMGSRSRDGDGQPARNGHHLNAGWLMRTTDWNLSAEATEVKERMYAALADRYAEAPWFAEVFVELPREQKYLSFESYTNVCAAAIEQNEAADVRAPAMLELGAPREPPPPDCRRPSRPRRPAAAPTRRGGSRHAPGAPP